MWPLRKRKTEPLLSRPAIPRPHHIYRFRMFMGTDLPIPDPETFPFRQYPSRKIASTPGDLDWECPVITTFEHCIFVQCGELVVPPGHWMRFGHCRLIDTSLTVGWNCDLTGPIYFDARHDVDGLVLVPRIYRSRRSLVVPLMGE